MYFVVLIYENCRLDYHISIKTCKHGNIFDEHKHISFMKQTKDIPCQLTLDQYQQFLQLPDKVQ